MAFLSHIQNDHQCPNQIGSSEIVNPLVPGSIKSQTVLNGYVGWIWCKGYGVLPQDKGLLVVDPVLMSYEQVTPLLPGRLVFNVLVNVESLVGKEVGMCKGHGKFKKQIGREVGDMGKSN